MTDYRAIKRGGQWWIGQHAQPNCFGQFYEGGLPGEGGADCRSCIFGALCLAHFLEVTLPAAEERLGRKKPATAEMLAKDLGLAVESIVYAQKERERRVPARPTMAGSADAAADPAPKSWGASGKVAGAAVERAPRLGLEWKARYDEKRWRRERERSPEIAALTPGRLLRVSHHDQWYECKVMKRGYVFQNRLYPTLYAVTKAAVGVREVPRQLKHGHRPEGVRYLSPYSAAKFWKLGRYENKRLPKKSRTA